MIAKEEMVKATPGCAITFAVLVAEPLDVMDWFFVLCGVAIFAACAIDIPNQRSRMAQKAENAARLAERLARMDGR